jgi:predicted transcriptional regulator
MASRKVEKLIGTPKELSEITGINQAVLSVLLNLAKDSGKAKVIRKIETGGRGRPSSIWEISDTFSVHLKKVEDTEETTEDTEVPAT